MGLEAEVHLQHVIEQPGAQPPDQLALLSLAGAFGSRRDQLLAQSLQLVKS